MPRSTGDGGWVPIDRRIVAALPSDRPLSEVEAMVSLSVDLDQGKRPSIRAYAARWRWDRKRVRRFLQRHLEGGGEGPAQGPGAGPPPVPPNFTYVAVLRGSKDRERDHQGDHPRDPSGETQTSDRQKSARKAPRKPQRPWHGLGRDLDRLLACEAYVRHLAQRSPVLGSWSFGEIRAWARQVVAKGDRKREARGEGPLRSYPHFLQQCIGRVSQSERPTVAESRDAAPPEVQRALEGFRV